MRVVVVGNEKGGSGKSTTAAHLALGLLLLGKRVATLEEAGERLRNFSQRLG